MLFSPNWGQRFSNISNSFFELENGSGVDEGVDSASRDYQNTRKEDEQHLQLKDCSNHSFVFNYTQQFTLRVDYASSLTLYEPFPWYHRPHALCLDLSSLDCIASKPHRERSVEGWIL